MDHVAAHAALMVLEVTDLLQVFLPRRKCQE
jgi:hypothetical protein